jgi:hypothetical protein
MTMRERFSSYSTLYIDDQQTYWGDCYTPIRFSTTSLQWTYLVDYLMFYIDQQPSGTTATHPTDSPQLPRNE